MAVDTASSLGNLGDQGARVLKAMFTTTRAPTLAHRFARKVVINYTGNPTVGLPRRSGGPAAAARTENAAAVTPTGVTTINLPTLTPAEYGLAMGVSDPAFNRVTSENNAWDMIREDLLYAMMRYVDADPTVGIAAALYGGLANQVGTSAAALAQQVFVDAFQAITVTSGVGADVHVVAHIESKGRNDLWKEGRNSSSTEKANPEMGPELKALFSKRLFDSYDGNGVYLYSIQGRIHVFVSPDSSELATSGGDKVGAVYVPDVPGLQEFGISPNAGAQKVQPTFGFIVREDPAPSVRKTATNFAIVQHTTGVHVIASRAFGGVYQYVEDAISAAGTGELYDLSGRGLIYSAT